MQRPDERRASALINAAALRHNLAVARRQAPGCKVMAVVKSDAYGHGMALVTAALAGRVDAFAVATVQEGIDCRAAHPQTAVTVLSELQRPAALEVFRRHGLDPVLHTPTHVDWFVRNLHDGSAESAARRLPPPAPWVKIDTGMNRLGLAPAQVGEAIAKLRRAGVKNLRLMSHLANADDRQDDYSITQLTRFRQCTAPYVAQPESSRPAVNQPEVNQPRATQLAAHPLLERSLANSAGVMQWPQTHFQWVRPGMMLYGGSPLLGRCGAELGLRAVMHLQARLLAIKRIEAGQSVGYGGAFVSRARMPMGIVGFGYADGYPRLVEQAAVLIGGVRAPIIGRVSMDMLSVDLSACPQAVVGDQVTLWGERLGVDEVAAWSGLSPYELLCGVGGRIARVGVDEP